MPEVFAAEEHHQVLVPWSRLRRRLTSPPAVLTLDHHTDVMPAFGRFADGNESLRRSLISDFDFRSDSSVRSAVSVLRHDEHIDLALRSGIISESLIIAHENFTVPAHPDIKIYVDPLWPDAHTMLNNAEAFRPYADRMLESGFLSQAGFRAAHWILDIDLDCLLTARSVMPSAPEYFRFLWHRSELVTVSMERDWVRLLRLPGENIDSDYLLDALLELCGGVIAGDKV